jgi:hypothetical protein
MTTKPETAKWNREIPKFSKYASPGDSVTWVRGIYDMRAVLHDDPDTKPTDFECYSDDQIAAWAQDEWFYVGVVVTASLAGTELGSASVWGVDCNFPDSNNDYLSEVAAELQDEAIAEADKQREAISAAALRAIALG